MKQIVMLYGLCGSPEHFEPQKNFFADKAEVYVPDWFELCKGAINSKGNIILQIARLLIGYLEQKKVTNPVLIGHSMGGVIALTMANELHYPIDKLIILDTSLTPTAEKKAAYKVLCQQFLDEPNNKKTVEKFFREYTFAETDDKKTKDYIIELAVSRLDLFWFEALDSAVDSDFPALISHLTMPMLYVGSEKPFANQQQLKTINPKMQFAKVSKSGHFITLFAAKQVNKLIQKFIECNNIN